MLHSLFETLQFQYNVKMNYICDKKAGSAEKMSLKILVQT